MSKIKASILTQELMKIQTLVGDITEEDLKYVDCFVEENLSIFIPSVGFCQYAIKPAHTHPSYSFVIFFSEEQTFFEKSIFLPEAHYLAAALSPDIPHEEKETDEFTRYIAIFIEKDFYENLKDQYRDNQSAEKYFWKQFPVAQEIMMDIKRFMTEYENKAIGYEKCLKALTILISSGLLRDLYQINNTHRVIETFDIEGIIEFMEESFGKKITLESLSKKIGISESQFIRKFKQATGLSPIDFFMKIRIEKAQKLLRIGTKNITEIAQDCGFGSTAHFSSSFKKYVKLSPSSYKQMYKNT